MRDTIKAKDGYRIVKVKNIVTGEEGYRIDDGCNPLFVPQNRTASRTAERFQPCKMGRTSCSPLRILRRKRNERAIHSRTTQLFAGTVPR